jgi:5'(3')-deoxyribonucleotidase
MRTFKEILLRESDEKRKLKFYVDMDGVLADFDGEIEKSSAGKDVNELILKIKTWMQDNNPDREWRQLHDISDLAETSSDFAKLYKEASETIKKEARKSGFFRKLQPNKGAAEILNAAREVSGQMPSILTACVSSSYCVPEKEAWMKYHFPGMYDRILFEQDKEKYAQSRMDVLVDDREKNVQAFSEAGGSIIYAYDDDPERTIKLIRELKL